MQAVNARLLDPSLDPSYYRDFERNNKELIEELLKVKKLEREERKDNSLEEAYKKIRLLGEKTKKEAAAVNAALPANEGKKEEKSDPNLIQSLLSLFRK